MSDDDVARQADRAHLRDLWARVQAARAQHGPLAPDDVDGAIRQYADLLEAAGNAELAQRYRAAGQTIKDTTHRADALRSARLAALDAVDDAHEAFERVHALAEAWLDATAKGAD